MRLIDADVLIQEINEQCPDYKSNSVGCIVKSALNDCLKIIRRQPTIEAVPVVHGKWIHIESSDTMTGRAYECSNCKKNEIWFIYATILSDVRREDGRKGGG